MSRNVIVSDEALKYLDNYIDYLISEGAVEPATRLSERFFSYIKTFLAIYPATGSFIFERNLYEVWISGTRLIVWYRFDDETLEIIDIWHTSQDR